MTATVPPPSEQASQMTPEKIEAVLRRAMTLRHPYFAESFSARAKVTALESYIELTAYHRGELEEALYWASDAGKLLRHQWDQIEGYDTVTRGKGPHTKEQVNEAKRTIRPDLWEGIQDAKKLCEDIGRQIRRLELDFQSASRSYSLITGSG
jgi:hypothetical protein